MPTKDGRTLKVGVLGCGPIAQAAHFESCTKARNADLYAICDIAPDLLERMAWTHKPERTFPDYDAMLADPALDAVIIATSDAFHVPASLAALAAGFPAGTVSGAPKVRAMEIIDELEKHKRGPYAGCIGYFGADGEMDTCIVLRTAVLKDGRMSVQAGAGIVYDSDPASEQQECVNKAKALFRAADEAFRFAAQARRGQ